MDARGLATLAQHSKIGDTKTAQRARRVGAVEA